MTFYPVNIIFVKANKFKTIGVYVPSLPQNHVTS